jgi:hypothetical protein
VLRGAQQVLGSYTLQATLQHIVTEISAVADSVTARILAAEALASYASIHPLYIQARPFSHSLLATLPRCPSK